MSKTSAAKSSASKASLAALAAQASGEPIGDCVYWEIGGRHPHARFVEEFTKRGLDVKILPEAIDTERAVRRAVRSAAKSKGTTRLVRSVTDGAELVVGVVTETSDVAAKELSYQQTDTLSYNKSTKRVESTSQLLKAKVDAETAALEKQIEGIDLMRCLVRWIEGAGGFPLREAGGFYWLPPKAGKDIRLIGEAIEAATDNECAVYQLPLTRTPGKEAEKGLARSARAGLEAQISDVAAEIAEFQKEAPRAGTLERRLERFADLRNRATMYRDVLNTSSTDLESKISEMESVVKGLLAAIPANDAKPVATTKCVVGDKVKLKAASAAEYAATGLTADEVVTVTGDAPARGCVWVAAGVGLKLMVAKKDLEPAA